MITAAPPGFVRYMTEYPAEVAVTAPAILPDSALDQVNAINRYWNEKIEPIADAVWQGMSPADMNHWKVLLEGGLGVCHDFAVTKLHALRSVVLQGGLSLAYCHREWDGSKMNHLVLLACFDSGVRVLDNLDFDFYPLEDCIYDMISRQTWGNPQQWEEF